MDKTFVLCQFDSSASSYVVGIGKNMDLLAFFAKKYAFLLNNMRVEYTQSGKTS